MLRSPSLDSCGLTATSSSFSSIAGKRSSPGSARHRSHSCSMISAGQSVGPSPPFRSSGDWSPSWVVSLVCPLLPQLHNNDLTKLQYTPFSPRSLRSSCCITVRLGVPYSFSLSSRWASGTEEDFISRSSVASAFVLSLPLSVADHHSNVGLRRKSRHCGRDSLKRPPVQVSAMRAQAQSVKPIASQGRLLHPPTSDRQIYQRIWWYHPRIWALNPVHPRTIHWQCLRARRRSECFIGGFFCSSWSHSLLMTRLVYYTFWHTIYPLWYLGIVLLVLISFVLFSHCISRMPPFVGWCPANPVLVFVLIPIVTGICSMPSCLCARLWSSRVSPSHSSDYWPLWGPVESPLSLHLPQNIDIPIQCEASLRKAHSDQGAHFWKWNNVKQRLWDLHSLGFHCEKGSVTLQPADEGVGPHGKGVMWIEVHRRKHCFILASRETGALKRWKFSTLESIIAKGTNNDFSR